MAVTSGFFNSLNGDRKYNAEQMSALFNGLINDGVFATVGDAFAVEPGLSNDVLIGSGRAWFNGIWVNNDATLPMTLNNSEVLLDRIDAVVIEINRTEAIREGRIVFVTGAPGTSPSRPTMIHSDGVDQYPLAYIRRKAATESVTAGDITVVIGTSECPYVTGLLSVVTIDNILAKWDSEFNSWFDDLQTLLTGDVAANLAAQILELDGKFQTLAREKAVYEALEDTSEDEIEDSSGNVIEGRTMLSGGGESSGSSSEQYYADIANIYNMLRDINKETSSLGYQVGDVLTTARTDLDDTWLLCNGELVSRGTYQTLSDLIPDGPTYNEPKEGGQIASASSDTTGWPKVSKMVYGGGYRAYAMLVKTASSESVIVYYKSVEDDIFEEHGWSNFTSKTIFSKTNKDFFTYDIHYNVVFDYIGGRFMVCYSTQEQESNGDYSRKLICAYSPVNNIAGSWTKREVASRTESSSWRYTYYPHNLKYVNGTYVICGFRDRDRLDDGNNYKGSAIWYSTNLTSWSEYIIYDHPTKSGGWYNGCEDIIYQDGKYIAIGLFSSGTGTTGVSYATALTGPWTAPYPSSSSAGSPLPSNAQRIIYSEKDDVYISWMLNSPSIYYTSDLDGVWASFSLNNIFDFDGTGYKYSVDSASVALINDRYTISAIFYEKSSDGSTCSNVHYRIVSSDSLDGPWIGTTVHTESFRSHEGSFPLAYDYMTDIGVGDTEYGVMIRTNLANDTSGYVDGYFWDRTAMTLPSFSLTNGLYAYIKALEG